MKNTITQLEFCQVLGLLIVAATHHDAIKTVETALNKTVGLPADDWGSHIQDAVWGGETDAKRLLGKMGIAVEEGEAA